MKKKVLLGAMAVGAFICAAMVTMMHSAAKDASKIDDIDFGLDEEEPAQEYQKEAEDVNDESRP